MSERVVVKLETILAVLEAAAAKEKIADAAVAWRQAMLGGRFDKATSKLSTLFLIIDDHLKEMSTAREDLDTGSSGMPSPAPSDLPPQEPA